MKEQKKKPRRNITKSFIVKPERATKSTAPHRAHLRAGFPTETTLQFYIHVYFSLPQWCYFKKMDIFIFMLKLSRTETPTVKNAKMRFDL